MHPSLHPLSEYKWEVSPSRRMTVPGTLFLTERLYRAGFDEKALEQIVNAASLPGRVEAVLAMPDIHCGYGLPIGGVLVTDSAEGVVSPGAVGYDINCGVRLLRTNLEPQSLLEKREALLAALLSAVPTGVGTVQSEALSRREGNRVLREGAAALLRRGMAEREDLERTESSGSLPGAEDSLISDRAWERGSRQLGTLGAGNHFLEVQRVVEVYDPERARLWGLTQETLTIMVHTGSRGLGHQICTEALEKMERAARKYRFTLPDRELACAPADSPEGREYLAAMACGANFAWANRQAITHRLREVFSSLFGPRAALELVYDHGHNVVREETHRIADQKRLLLVHRKGATRAFPAGHTELPPRYSSTGQPVLIPGDMGRFSFVLAAAPTALQESFGSTCHGAGRLLSRNQAVKRAKGRSIEREMEEKGILLGCANRRTLEEESSEAYKDAGLVVEAVVGAGLSTLVCRLQPLLVVKG